MHTSRSLTKLKIKKPVRTGSMLMNPFLMLLEYFLKLSSGVVALIALGSGGPFLVKLGTGFGSLFSVLRQIFEFPEKVVATMAVINDYNTLTAAAFNQRYGTQAITNVMVSLNEGVAYFQAVYQNLAYQPLSTLMAAALSLIIMYVLGRGMRFIRQKGQGSYFDRMERKLGQHLFETGENPVTPERGDEALQDKVPAGYR